MPTFDEDLLRAPKTPATKAESNAGPEHADGPVGTHSPAAILQMQRFAGNAAVLQRLQNGDEDAQSVARATSSGGQPLDTTTRVQMEQSMGTDFSDVRVHSGSTAAESAKDLGAHAYTVGSDVVLGQGHDSSSETGQRTLAHELTHVVQQRSGPVEGTETGGGVKVSDPSDRFEQAAEANADQVMASRSFDTASPVGASSGGTTVQREGEEGEEEMQQLAIQREGEEGEEEIQALAIQREGEEEVPEEMAS